jgi:hypothetical protein
MRRDFQYTIASTRDEGRPPRMRGCARVSVRPADDITLTAHPPPATDDRSVAPSYRTGWDNQQIAHALMVAFVMVVLRELGNGAA